MLVERLTHEVCMLVERLTHEVALTEAPFSAGLALTWYLNPNSNRRGVKFLLPELCFISIYAPSTEEALFSFVL